MTPSFKVTVWWVKWTRMVITSKSIPTWRTTTRLPLKTNPWPLILYFSKKMVNCLENSKMSKEVALSSAKTTTLTSTERSKWCPITCPSALLLPRVNLWVSLRARIPTMSKLEAILAAMNLQNYPGIVKTQQIQNHHQEIWKPEGIAVFLEDSWGSWDIKRSSIAGLRKSSSRPRKKRVQWRTSTVQTPSCSRPSLLRLKIPKIL